MAFSCRTRARLVTRCCAVRGVVEAICRVMVALVHDGPVSRHAGPGNRQEAVLLLSAVRKDPAVVIVAKICCARICQITKRLHTRKKRPFAASCHRRSSLSSSLVFVRYLRTSSKRISRPKDQAQWQKRKPGATAVARYWN